jgi:hypothetical protein
MQNATPLVNKTSYAFCHQHIGSDVRSRDLVSVSRPLDTKFCGLGLAGSGLGLGLVDRGLGLVCPGLGLARSGLGLETEIEIQKSAMITYCTCKPFLILLNIGTYCANL